jgi:hypothetical protein
MKTYGGVDVQTHVLLTLALVGGEWSASRPGRFTPGERAPGSHWIEGWVDPRAGLDNMEKWKLLPPHGLELWPPSCPACSPSLYLLHYPSSHIKFNTCSKHSSVDKFQNSDLSSRVWSHVSFCPFPSSSFYWPPSQKTWCVSFFTPFLPNWSESAWADGYTFYKNVW